LFIFSSGLISRMLAMPDWMPFIRPLRRRNSTVFSSAKNW
jgi:hypothetical protein